MARGRISNALGKLTAEVKARIDDDTKDELDRIQALYDDNFGIEEPPMNFKGVMTRDQVHA